MSSSSTSSSDRRPKWLWVLLGVVVAIGGMEVALRALGTLPRSLEWHDWEAQIKATHADNVRRKGERVQVVFAGSSISDAAFDPALLVERSPNVETAYNYAQQGAAARTNARYLSDVIVKRVKPDVVVIGLTPNELNDNGRKQQVEYDLMVSSRGFRRSAGTPDVKDRIAGAFEQRSALVKHRALLRDPYRFYRWIRKRDDGTRAIPVDRKTGALTRHSRRTFEAPKASAIETARTQVFNDFAVGGRQLQAIIDMAKVFRSQGIATAIVELPVYRASYTASLDGAQAMLDRTHEAIEKQLAGQCIGRVDLRNELQDARFWSDSSHPNGAGAEQLTTLVSAWIDRNWATITSDGCLQ